MPTATEPCEWPLVGADDCDAIQECGYPAEVKAAAVAYLWNWTGKRYGLCEVAVRPRRQDCHGSTYAGRAGHPDTGGWNWTPVLIGGEWFNIGCGDCGDVCGCSSLASIRLPGPVEEVTQVLIDGVALDAAAYRVDNRKRLVRHDGGRWPLCNDLTEASTEAGTWEVTYKRGVPVPKGGQIAAATLACEIAKGLRRSSDCRLPERIQTVTREGVTVGVLDPFDGLEGGRTGIWLIDSWVASITSSPTRSTVHSPDRRGTQRTTSP